MIKEKIKPRMPHVCASLNMGLERATRVMCAVIEKKPKMTTAAMMILMLLVSFLPVLAFDGQLFIASDVEEFGTLFPPDRLFVAATSGPAGLTVSCCLEISTPFPINGLGEGDGFLYAGQPLTEAGPGNTLRQINYDGSLIRSVVSAPPPDAFPTVCCNEEMVVFEGAFYHAHFDPSLGSLGVIQSLGPFGEVLNTWTQPDVVGMAVVDALSGEKRIWITHWSARQVGIWRPDTNSFHPEFTTPANAGGLAWDPNNRVLWVGLQGGLVVPYNLSGTPLSPGFFPFGGPVDQTIDGLAFVPEPIN